MPPFAKDGRDMGGSLAAKQENGRASGAGCFVAPFALRVGTARWFFLGLESGPPDLLGWAEAAGQQVIKSWLAGTEKRHSSNPRAIRRKRCATWCVRTSLHPEQKRLHTSIG